MQTLTELGIFADISNIAPLEDEPESCGILSLIDDVLPSGGKGFLVMMKVFLDLGNKTDENDRIVTIAAAVFKPDAYKRFVRPWNRMLRRWDASAFHATDFYSGAEEFNRDAPERKALFNKDSRKIPNLIGSKVTRLIAVSFRPNEVDLVAPTWKKQFGLSMHSLSVQLCMSSIGKWADQNHPSEKFAYFMESGDTDQGEVETTVARMKANVEISKHIRVASFTSVDKNTARGLEVSDFVAWHWNKFYMDKFRSGNDVPRKDFAAFIDITKEKVESAFLTGDKLKKFLSIPPLLAP